MTGDSWRERERIVGPYPSGRPATGYRKKDMLFLTVKKYLPAKKRNPRTLINIKQEDLIDDFKFRKESISPMLEEYKEKDLGDVFGPELPEAKGMKIFATPNKFVLDDDIGLVSHRVDGENMVVCTRCATWMPMPKSYATAIFCRKCGCIGFIVPGGLSPLWPLLTGLTILALSSWSCPSDICAALESNT